MLTLTSGVSGQAGDLVAAVDRALNGMRSSGQTIEDGDDPSQRLVAAVDALAGPERDQVAQALTQLWDAFNERFNGVQGFLSAEFAARNAYVSQLEGARERMAPHRHGAAAHYYQATALMLAYVRAVMQQQSLEARVVEAVHRGRVLSREGLRSRNAQRTRQVSSIALCLTTETTSPTSR